MIDEIQVVEEQEQQVMEVQQPSFKRQVLTPSIWRMIQEIAPVIHKSRLFGVRSSEAAAAIMLKGHELGLGITTAFEFIQEIQGKPSLIPRGAWALVINSDELEKSKIHDEIGDNGLPYACTVYLKRTNGMDYTCRITMDDARRSGVVKEGSGWEKYPANMLRWRAIGFALDVVFPDVQGGMKRADEFGAEVDYEGNVVEAAWSDIPASSAYKQTSPQLQEPTTGAATQGEQDIQQDPQPKPGIQDLIDTYGAEKVLEAVNKVTAGKMPDSQEQVDEIAKELEQ